MLPLKLIAEAVAATTGESAEARHHLLLDFKSSLAGFFLLVGLGEFVHALRDGLLLYPRNLDS